MSLPFKIATDAQIIGRPRRDTSRPFDFARDRHSLRFAEKPGLLRRFWRWLVGDA